MIDDQEIEYVNTRTVQCEGNAAKIGHPLVYLEIKENEITCPYCSKHFIYQP
jgi:uncharacterized Zn-finger protein